MISGRLLARNSILNLLGQLLPLTAAVVAIPALVAGLGTARFGVLMLAWAAIGYFSLFELGLGRALTQAVAQRLGAAGDEELPSTVRAALGLLTVFGSVGGIVLAAISQPLVVRVLNVPAELHGEAVRAFWILSAALPVMLITSGLRGLMEAHQHFGVATALRIPLAMLTFLGPLMLLPWSTSLVPAVALLAVGRVIGLVAHVWVCWRRYPLLRRPAVLRRESAIALLRFGGWTTVSNIVSPMMVYLDRFVIGALLTVAAVTHYVTPHEVVVRLLVIPVSVTGALLPAFASVVGRDPQRMAQVYEKSLRAVTITTFPVVLLAVALAHEGLRLWVGTMLPAESAVVLQWLAVGLFVTAVAQPPFAALQSAGRPDLIAKLHLLELPLYAASLFVLTRAFGLRGVAIAWTARAAIDMLALSYVAHRQLGVALVPRLGGAVPMAAMLGALAVAATFSTTPGRALYAAGVLVLFVPLAWFVLLTPDERIGIRNLMSPVPRAAPRPSAAEEPV